MLLLDRAATPVIDPEQSFANALLHRPACHLQRPVGTKVLPRAGGALIRSSKFEKKNAAVPLAFRLLGCWHAFFKAILARRAHSINLI
jgi:hypothetical protein